MNAKITHQPAIGKSSQIAKTSNLKLNLDLGKLEVRNQNSFASQQGVSTAKNSSSTQSANPFGYINQLKLSPKGHNAPRFTDATPVNNTPELLAQSVYPLTAKGSKDQAAYFNQLQDKGKKSQQQTSSFKENMSKQGGSIYSTQILLSQTNSPKTDEIKKGEFTVPNESVPQSKQSVRNDSQKNPNAGNLANALNSIYSPQLRNQAQDQSVNRQAVQAFEPNVASARRNSNAGPKEQNQVSNSRSNPAGRNQSELQNFLEDIASTDQDPVKGFQRSSINTSSNPAAGNQRMAPSNTQQYQDMIKNLSDKNQELDSLGKENSELKATLGSLANELRELKKMKTQMAEKDKLIAELKSTLGGKLHESQEPPQGIDKDSNLKATFEYLSKNQFGQDLISNEGVEGLLNQFNKANSKDKQNRITEQDQPKSPDNKLSLLELLKQHSNNNTNVTNQGANSKKSGSSYMLSNLEYRTERNSNPVNAISQGQLYQRNFSTTLETSKKKLESPYYENLNGKRELAGNDYSTNNAQKKQNESRGNIKKPLQMPQSTSNKTAVSSLNFKKGELSEVLRKSSTGRVGGLQIKNELQFEKNPGFMLKATTTAASVDPTKRKFSHDPKTSSVLTHTVTPSDSDHVHPSSFRGEKSYRQSSTEKPLDFAVALNTIKERIKSMLDKHRQHHNSLKQTNALILEKLEKLAIDQSSLAP